MGGVVQINPVWTYGPFDANRVSAPAQPDWYVGWLDGALRLFPPVEFTVLGITIPSVFVPAIVIPGIAFGIMTLWPFIEPRLTGDRDEHHILDRPRDNALRTSVGVAGLLVFVVLTVAAGNDVAALVLNIPVEVTTELLRIGFFVIPLLGFFVTYRICKELQRRTDVTDARQPVRLRRTAAGGFEEAE
jgi:ubiquinol-cytochrome c reductase cytochrome b subunit